MPSFLKPLEIDLNSVNTGKEVKDEESNKLLAADKATTRDPKDKDLGFGFANDRAKDNPFDLNDSDSEDDHLEQDRFDELIYFKDQFGDLKFQRDCRAVHKYHKFQHSFDLWYFLEAFIINFVYHVWTGPFIYVAAFFYWPYFKMFGNMGFLDGKGFHYWLWLCLWIMNWVCIYCHYDREYNSITYNFIVMMYFLTLVRSITVASKYATFSRDYRRRLLKRYVSSEERAKFQLMGAWNDQNNHVIKRELDFSLRRKMIDVATFKVSFIDPPSYIIANSLNDNTVFPEYCKNHAAYKIPGKEACIQYYDCRAIMYNLLSMHTKYRTSGILMYVGVAASVLWMLLPGLTRLLVGFNFCGYGWNEILVFFLVSLSFFLIFYLGFAFFRRTYLDLDRIDFLNKQLSQMLSPTKIPTIPNKIFPTINLADPISLQSWLNMRRIAFDYGVNFTNRHKIFVTMCYMFTFVSFLLIAFKAVIFQKTPGDEMTMAMLVLLYIIIVYGAMTVALARKLLLTNDSYYSQIYQIRNNK